MVRHEEGYTLTELVVVILIFSTVMTIISVSFNRIVSSSGQIMKSAQTDIGGLIGLELLRLDLGFAGFGLPWSLGDASYSGESESHQVDGNPDTDAATFNDSSTYAPRAFVLLNDKGFKGSDYLVLKGTALGMTSTSRGWSYLNYSSTGMIMKVPKAEGELSPDSKYKDRVIILNSGARGGAAVRELVSNGSTFSVSFDRAIDKKFQPKSKEDSYLVYGISPAPDPKDTEDKITFPFNRADYYIGPSTGTSGGSSHCAPGTGHLYRGMVSQKGNFTPAPVLDCVADLQVVFMLSTSNDGTLVPENDISDFDAGGLREHVEEVRVYILAQQGKKDNQYSYPVTNNDRAIVVGDPGYGRVWKRADLAAKFGDDWQHYHWKLYTIAVQPQNLR